MVRPALIAAALLMVPAPAFADPDGVWTTPKAKVRISDCGGGLCATILSLKEPNDAEGRPKLDAKNADESRRGRPIVGVSVLSGMKREGEGWRGQIYNPEDGKTYKAFMTEQGDGELKVQGCALGGLVCKTQVWKRGG